MPLPQHPDAVIFPRGKIKGSTSEQHAKVKKVFAPVLNCQKVWTKDQTSFNFTYPNVRADGTAGPHLSLLFPTDHALARSERFDWHVATQAKDGSWTVDESTKHGYADELDKVKFGYLKPEVAGDDDPGLIESVVKPSSVVAAKTVSGSVSTSTGA